jgi:hypothetical protein
MPSIAPVMGSLSLNAISIGVALSHNTFHGLRLAIEAGSSSVVGIRPGIALAPTLYASSGNGAS